MVVQQKLTQHWKAIINHSRILYDPPPRLLEIKAKINKWDLIKIKSFCTTKETLSKVKRQPSEWEKIIANETTDKQLISKIYKQLLQLNSRKIISHFDINFSFKCFLLGNHTLYIFSLLILLRFSMAKSKISLGNCYITLENMGVIFKYLLI